MSTESCRWNAINLACVSCTSAVPPTKNHYLSSSSSLRATPSPPNKLAMLSCLSCSAIFKILQRTAFFNLVNCTKLPKNHQFGCWHICNLFISIFLFLVYRYITGTTKPSHYSRLYLVLLLIVQFLQVLGISQFNIIIIKRKSNVIKIVYCIVIFLMFFIAVKGNRIMYLLNHPKYVYLIRKIIVVNRNNFFNDCTARKTVH